MSNKIEEVYGKNLFHDEVLKERLPAETYEALQRTIQDGAELEPQTADVIADAMMKWAVERGYQPAFLDEVIPNTIHF